MLTPLLWQSAVARTQAAATAIAAAAIGLAGAMPASAAPPVAPLGTTQNLVDGAVVSGWTVSNLQPSNDMVTAPIAGELWEATATVSAVRGTVAPAVPFFNARTADGQNYRALFQAPAPEGLDGAPLPEGAQSSGKVYFDVTGAQPDTVVYNDAVQDRLIWD